MKRKNKLAFFTSQTYLRNILMCLFVMLGAVSYGQLTGIQANLSVVDGVATETPGNPAQFQITLTPNGGIPISGDRNVTYSITGVPVNGADYTLISGSVLIPSGQTVGFINITPIEETFVENDEFVIITLTNTATSNYDLDPIVANRTKQIVIQDNDTAVVSISPGQVSINENGSNGQLSVNLSNPKGGAVNVIVNFVTTQSTATGPGAAPNDFSLTGTINPAGTAVLFPTGNNQIGTVNVVPLDDVIPEDDETVVVTLTSTNNPQFTIDPVNNTATVTIVDNDCAAGTVAPPKNAKSPDRCDEASLNLNTLITGGAGSAPAGTQLRWSLVANPTAAGQLLTAPTVTSSNTYFGLYWDNVNLCASPSTQVVVTMNTSPNAGANVNAARCNESGFGVATSINLQNTLQGEDAGGTWAWVSGPANVPINGATVVNFNNDPVGTYRYRYTLVGPGACNNDTADIVITVTGCDPCVAGNTAPVLNANVPTNFCDDVTQSLNDYTSSAPPAGTTLKWSTSSDLEDESAHRTPAQIASPLPGTYYGFFWDATNTCASPALVVSLVLTDTPTISATTGDERCGPGQVTLTATVTGSPTINWYGTATSSAVLGTGSSFTRNVNGSRSFWVQASENNCVSPRVEVMVEVIAQPSAGTPTDTSSCSDSTFGNTVLNLNGQLAGADPGTWVFTSGPMSVDPGNGDAVDFMGSLDGVYVFTYTTTGAVVPCVNESTSVTVSVSNCDTDDDGDGLFGGTEQALGTDPQNADTDEDGIQDGVEVGPDINNPLDEDQDGIIDALDSNIADIDTDGVVDQLDPANEDPCIPNRLNGVCDFDNDDIPDSEEEANGSDPDDPCSPNPDHENCSPIDLEILKVVDNENAVVGDTVTFTVTVNNLDPTRKARSIIIGDLLEVGFEYVSNIVSTGSFDVTTSEWSVPELEPMTMATLAMDVLILEGGPYTNTATLLSSLPEDETVANNEATAQVNINLPVGVDLVLEKTALSVNPLINEMVIFTIKVTNQSVNGDTVNNIQVEDLIPSGVDSPFVYVSHEATGTYDLVSGIWMIETLSLGQVAELTIVVNVPIQGSFSNTARIIRSSPADANPINNEMTVTVNVSKPNPAEVGFLFNQFSPNGDGTNDFLQINNTDPRTQQTVTIGYNVQIFNRYGNLVFNGKNMTETKVWDGSWKGKDAPDGTYFYVMNINVGNGPQTKKGWIQLIR